MALAVGLQAAVMGCRDNRRMFFPQFVEHRNRQALAFSRIGAAADFIQKDQRVFGCFRKHFGLLFHMRGKGAQRARHRLIIADVRKHPVKIRKHTAFRNHRHPAGGHQRKQADDLEADSFTAGVGSGDQQGPLRIGEMIGIAHRFPIGDQRMSCIFDFDLMTLAQHRRTGIVFHSPGSPGKDRIEQ